MPLLRTIGDWATMINYIEHKPVFIGYSFIQYSPLIFVGERFHVIIISNGIDMCVKWNLVSEIAPNTFSACTIDIKSQYHLNIVDHSKRLPFMRIHHVLEVNMYHMCILVLFPCWGHLIMKLSRHNTTGHQIPYSNFRLLSHQVKLNDET